MDLENEAKQWMKEKRVSSISATLYQEKACEIANKIKKFIRDGAAQDEYLAKRIEIGYEIGDVLWYCAVLAKEMEMDLGHIMENNLQKLADRKKRGTLSGSGDNR
jgi:NTP pyrophosphatase (non-canonical NTP hydrolase)